MSLRIDRLRPEPQRPTPCPALSSSLRTSLRCPLSGQELIDGVDDDGSPVLLSQAVDLAYPVRDGVPILLVHEAKRTSVPRG